MSQARSDTEGRRGGREGPTHQNGVREIGRDERHFNPVLCFKREDADAINRGVPRRGHARKLRGRVHQARDCARVCGCAHGPVCEREGVGEAGNLQQSASRRELQQRVSC